MDTATVRNLIRQGIREPTQRRISNSLIDNVITEAINVLGMKIKEIESAYYNVRKSLSSYTNVFSCPSDCVTVLKVWDLDDNAITITGAADNGSGAIRITAASHGFVTSDIVTIHDVGGCTEANDVWKITKITANTFDLQGSTFTNTYTSGGKAYEEPEGLQGQEITRVAVEDATNSNDAQWYPRKKTIVVDDDTFTNDIIIDYISSPSAISDIPAEYHQGIVSFGIVNTMMVPKQDQPDYADKVASVEFHKGLWDYINRKIEETLTMSHEPINIADEEDYVDNF